MQDSDNHQRQRFVTSQLNTDEGKLYEPQPAECPPCVKRVSELERHFHDHLLQQAKFIELSLDENESIEEIFGRITVNNSGSILSWICGEPLLK